MFDRLNVASVLANRNETALTPLYSTFKITQTKILSMKLSKFLSFFFRSAWFGHWRGRELSGYAAI